MSKEKLISNLIEIIYLLAVFLYMLVLKVSFSTSSAYDFLMLIFFSAIIIGILILAGSKFNKYVGFILLTLYTLYLVAQNVYYRAFSQYFRFETAIGLSKEVAGVTDSIAELIHFEDILPFIILTVIHVLFIVLHFLFQKKYSYKLKYRLLSIIFVVIGFGSLFYNVSIIDASAEGWTNFDIYKSDYYIYHSMSNTNQFVNKFGLLSLLYRDAELTISSESNEIDTYIQEVDEFYASKENNHLDNELTGIFKDKSVLFIQAESFMNLAISEEFTPNLYYYMNNGIVVENFNTPLLIGSTSDTEFMSNTSIIPMTTGYPVCYEYINNSYPLTLGGIFKENGYTTYAFHNNYAEYYNRDVTFAKYGYEFFDSSKLGLENLEPDTKLAETIGWILSEKDKFASYWITYSGHQPYSLDSVGVDSEDVKLIKEKYPDLDDEYVSYIAKAMDVDKALYNFLNVMDWSGRLDEVVIVFYGDHYAKGLDFSKGSNWDQVMGTNSDDNPEILYTPFFIYSNNLSPMQYDKVSTTLDLIPTVVNLWDFDVDLGYSLGNDIFDPEYEGFFFDNNGNIITDNFIYNIIDDSLMFNNNYSEEEAMKEINYYSNLKDIASKILKSDYFAQKMGD